MDMERIPRPSESIRSNNHRSHHRVPRPQGTALPPTAFFDEPEAGFTNRTRTRGGDVGDGGDVGSAGNSREATCSRNMKMSEVRRI